MPLFEFVCTTCDKDFEELVRSSNDVQDVICPVCGSTQVKKKISKFASKLSSSSGFSFSSASSSCNTGGG